MPCSVTALVIIITVISCTQGILVGGAHIRGYNRFLQVGTDSSHLRGGTFLELNAKPGKLFQGNLTQKAISAPQPEISHSELQENRVTQSAIIF